VYYAENVRRLIVSGEDSIDSWSYRCMVALSAYGQATNLVPNSANACSSQVPFIRSSVIGSARPWVKFALKNCINTSSTNIS